MSEQQANSLWVPEGAPKKTGVAMIALTIGATPESGAVEHTTWALGTTPANALQSWKRKNRMMAVRLKSHLVVTSGMRPKNPTDWTDTIRRRDDRMKRHAAIVPEKTPDARPKGTQAQRRYS